jgi:enterochelin esterase family protein
MGLGRQVSAGYDGRTVRKLQFLDTVNIVARMEPTKLMPVLPLLLVLCVVARAEENKLPEILIEGEGWQAVYEGDAKSFTDGSCCDAEGNVYFSDMTKGVIFKIDAATGKAEPFVEVAKVSGMKWAPDGRLICCQNGAKKIIAIDKEKKTTVLAENVGCNDLIVSKKGIIYFTETGKGQVSVIDAKNQLSVGAKDLGRPNGISLSPDQKSLAVSDYGGVNVFTLKIADDGTLSDKAAPMTMQTPPPAEGKKPVSGGDGMTTDASGRYFVTSNLGVQVFDPSGKLMGIIERPQNKGAVNLAFGGPDLSMLFICNSDKVYKRKTKTKGIVFYK